MIEIRFTENFLKQQVKCLDILAELIEYDKQHSDPPENTRVLAAFIDTQRKALDMASKLLEKHKPALEEAEKAEREKQQAQEKIEAAKRKEEQKKEKVKEDLKKLQARKEACSAPAMKQMKKPKRRTLKKQTPKMTAMPLKKMKITRNEGAINEKTGRTFNWQYGYKK